MANPSNMPDVPDLDAFRERVEAATEAAQEFATTVGQVQGTQAPVTTGNQERGQTDQLLRDVLNALHLIHDEVVGLKQAVEDLGG
jgi:hypothetical protein